MTTVSVDSLFPVSHYTENIVVMCGLTTMSLSVKTSLIQPSDLSHFLFTKLSSVFYFCCSEPWCSFYAAIFQWNVVGESQPLNRNALSLSFPPPLNTYAHFGNIYKICLEFRLSKKFSSFLIVLCIFCTLVTKVNDLCSLSEWKTSSLIV